jgi:serine/threonine protein kinase
MDYISGGELFTYMERRGAMTEAEARFYTSEIALALGHLHARSIIFRWG